MKKSFDNSLKEKLSAYQQQPKPSLRSGVLGQIIVQSPWYSDAYRYIGVLLFFLSIFGIGSVEQVVYKQTNINAREISITSPSIKPPYEKLNVPQFNKPLSVVNEAEVQPKSTSAYKVREIVSNNQNEKSLTPDSPSSISDEAISTYSLHLVNSIPAFNDDIEMSDRSLMLLDEDEQVVLPVVHQNSKTFNPYYNIGSYFLYNRVRPNLSDEIYVGEFDSPNGLSASRLGFLAEFGMEKRLADNWSVRAGLAVNNYSQQYSFNIRQTKPDQVVASELNDGFFETSFDTKAVEISKRVTLIGLKSQLLWQVFPEKTNVLFFSGEYQHLLGKGPTLDFDNKEYQLMKQRQILLEIGLKKLVFEFDKTGLFLMPSLRYGLYKLEDKSVINVKPFSVGLTLSLGLK